MPRFPLQRLSKRLERLGTVQQSPPPGFDAAVYCRLNPDVGAAFPDPEKAAAHYVAYGMDELRRPMPEKTGIEDRQHRMLTAAADRQDWARWLRKQGDLRKVLAAHPRAGWLRSPFNLASYLLQRQDVAALLDNPLQGAFHFLEFGLEEGSYGYPAETDPAFLLVAYRTRLAHCTRTDLTNVHFAHKTLRDSGLDAMQLALSEAEYWELKGLPGKAMAKAFDHEWYHASATRQGIALPAHGRLDAIDHFCAQGIAKGLMAHPGHRFDAGFYIEHWLQDKEALPLEDGGGTARAARRAHWLTILGQDIGLETTAPLLSGDQALKPGTDISARLYRHWLHKGLRTGRAPNAVFWARTYFGIHLPETLALRLRCLAEEATEEYGGLLDRMTRLMCEPMPYLDHLPDLTFEEAIALSALGDKAAAEGKTDQAEWLYRKVLAQYPGHERTLNHLADLMARAGRKGAEYLLRVQSQALPGKKRGSGVSNALTLAGLALEQNRLRRTIDLLEIAPEGGEGNYAQHSTYKALAARLFDRLWKQIGLYAAEHGIPAAQALLQEVLHLATPELGPVAQLNRPVRHVALVANLDLYQCKLYRVDQKAEQLRQAGVEVTIFDQWQDLPAFLAQIDKADAAIFYRVPAFPAIMEAIAACATHGVPSFYEIDDLVFDTAQFPPALETYSGQITPEHHRDMACGVPLYAHAMRMCDYAIGSTRVLCAQMAPHVRTGRAFEHHNALGQVHLEAIAEQERLPPRPTDRPIVLFYGSGTLAHKDDFHNVLEPALARVLARYKGKVELRLVGSYGTLRHLDPRDPAVRILPPVWDFEQYCTLLARADIALSVLSPTPVTDAKSEIKWLEAAMFAIPSVVSRTATHVDVIEHGRTGFLCDTSRDFETHLRALIEDHDLRHRIGQAARKRILEGYNLDAMGKNLTQIFQAVTAPPRKKPLVVVVNVFYPPQAIGGATRVVHDNIRDLKARFGDAFDLCVICSREGAPAYDVSSYIQDGVPVWAIGTPDQKGTEMTPRDPRMAEVFGRLLDRRAPDLVHFHCIQRLTSSVVDAARKRDIPYLITVHDGWWISDRQFLLNPETDALEFYDYARLHEADTPPRARVLRPALAGARRILAVSEAFARIHRDCNLPNVVAVENGVSCVPQVTRLPHPEGRIRLAHIGGTERHKGLSVLRNALTARDYANLELLVIDHALPPGLVEHEIWGNTPVIRQGKLPQAQVDALYARIDVLVAPSLWPESYGLVTREALITGAWVVASDRGAVGSDVVEGVNGHVVDVSDYTGLMAVLARIDAHPEKYRNPPGTIPQLRRSEDQARDLAEMYQELIRQEGGFDIQTLHGRQ